MAEDTLSARPRCGLLDTDPGRPLEPNEERRSGFPWSAAMVERERYHARHVGVRRALLGSGSVSMNIAGGTHHAYADRAEGSASSTTSPLPPCTCFRNRP